MTDLWGIHVYADQNPMQKNVCCHWMWICWNTWLLAGKIWVMKHQKISKIGPWYHGSHCGITQKCKRQGLDVHNTSCRNIHWSYNSPNWVTSIIRFVWAQYYCQLFLVLLWALLIYFRWQQTKIKVASRNLFKVQQIKRGKY